jgi:hypothetical protein
VYGYIIFLTVIESLKVFSAVIFAWGNYKIVWVEVEIWFDRKWQGYLWTAAKVGLFLVSLVSIFYTVLYVALAGVWLDFRSLNSIADIATKRTSFEVATAGLLAAFTGLAFGNAVWALVGKSVEVDGRGNSAWKVSLPSSYLGVYSLTDAVVEPLPVAHCDVPVLPPIVG